MISQIQHPSHRACFASPFSCRGDARARDRPARPWRSQGTPELCLSVETPSSPPSRRTNRSHKPLPNSTVRLLETMFASDDVCQLSLDALEDVTGLSRRHIQMVLRALLAASIIANEDTGAGRHANRYHLLLTAGNDAP